MWATLGRGNPGWGGTLQSSANSTPRNKLSIEGAAGWWSQFSLQLSCTVLFCLTAFFFQTAPNTSQTSTLFSSTCRRFLRSEVVPALIPPIFHIMKSDRWQVCYSDRKNHTGLQISAGYYHLLPILLWSQIRKSFLVLFYGEWLLKALPHQKSFMNFLKHLSLSHPSTTTTIR